MAGGLTVAADIAALWTRWIDLLEAHGFAVRAVLAPGASEAELAALEVATGLELTAEIRALYRLNKGQRERPSLGLIREGRADPWPPNAAPPFGFYEFLGTHAAATAWQGWQDIAVDQGPDGMADFAAHATVSEPDKVKQQYWMPGWLPFSRDGGGNSFAFGFDPEPGGTVGQIIIIGSDEDHRQVFAPSIGAFLARLIDEWQQGRFEIEAQDDDARYYDLPFLRGVTSP